MICDRFFDASLAYQGYGRGLPLDFIDGMTGLVCGGSTPEITILLDIDTKTGLKRARERNRTQEEDEGRFEAEELKFYERVRHGYLELAARSPERIKVVPALGTIDEVQSTIRRVLRLD